MLFIIYKKKVNFLSNFEQNLYEYNNMKKLFILIIQMLVIYLKKKIYE